MFRIKLESWLEFKRIQKNDQKIFLNYDFSLYIKAKKNSFTKFKIL